MILLVITRIGTREIHVYHARNHADADATSNKMIRIEVLRDGWTSTKDLEPKMDINGEPTHINGQPITSLRPDAYEHHTKAMM